MGPVGYPSPVALVLLALLAGCLDPPSDVRGDGGAPSPDGLPAPDLGGAKVEPGPPAFTFVAFGDTQLITGSCSGAAPEQGAIPRVLLSLGPDLIVHVGDVVDRGSQRQSYDTFFNCYGPVLMRHPLFPTMGNHDADWGDGIHNYKKYLDKQLLTFNRMRLGHYPLWYKDDPTPYPTDLTKPLYKDKVPSGFTFKTYYAFRHRNAYFISFEQGTPAWTNTPKPWLEQHLKAARADRDIEHIFVFLHFPLYVSNVPEWDNYIGLHVVRHHYEQLFQKYDVTMVFSGHVHIYSHAYVPDDGAPTRTSSPPQTYPHDGKAIHYIVTGGGSWIPDPVPDENKGKSYDYIQNRRAGHHVVEVRVKGSSVGVTVVGVKGSRENHAVSVWDAFNLVP